MEVDYLEFLINDKTKNIIEKKGGSFSIKLFICNS